MLSNQAETRCGELRQASLVYLDRCNEILFAPQTLLDTRGTALDSVSRKHYEDVHVKALRDVRSLSLRIPAPFKT